MGYMHIDNLYKNQDVLLFKECYALEKVHGTSAHIKKAVDGTLHFFSGGEKHADFAALFDADFLSATMHLNSTVYGEAYGGKCQGMRATYGDVLHFIAFDAQVDDHWLAVPQMTGYAESLGLEVVPWDRVRTDVETLDALRDRPSDVAERRGCGEQLREGIVLRPPIEVTKNNGERIIAKHKGDAFSERIHAPKVRKEPLAVMTAANAIADEWVTEMRMRHVLDKLLPGGVAFGIKNTGSVINAMIEDVVREAAGEIAETREVRAAIGKRAGQMFRDSLRGALRA